MRQNTRSADARCAHRGRVHAPQASLAAEEYLRNLQHPDDCQAAPLLVHPIRTSGGLAAVLRDMAFCFAAAVKLGRTYVPEGDLGLYTDARTCWAEHPAPRRHECLVQPGARGFVRRMGFPKVQVGPVYRI